MDATFDVTPRVGNARQLFSVHLVYENHVSKNYNSRNITVFFYVYKKSHKNNLFLFTQRYKFTDYNLNKYNLPMFICRCFPLPIV